MSDAERIKFWTQHAIGSEADKEYLAACAQAQISIALSLERIAEALEFDDDEVSLAAVDASVKEYYAERLAESPVYAELQKAGMVATPTEEAARDAEVQARKWAEGEDFHAPPVSPVGDVRAAALEIEANIAYLEDMAAQESITNEVEAIITKHLFPAAKPYPPNIFDASSLGGTPNYTPPTETEDAALPNPIDGVCNRCGWEREHMAHHYQYGSHKYEPSPYKDLTEWRKANNVSQVLPNVE